MKRELKNIGRRPAQSNDDFVDVVLAGLFAGDERAEQVGQWMAGKEQQVLLEAARGSACDELLRSAAATGWMRAAKAEDTLKMAQALQPKRPVGAPVLRKTLGRLQQVAWWKVREPGITIAAIARKIGIPNEDHNDFRKFVRTRTHKRLIDAAVRLLRP